MPARKVIYVDDKRLRDKAKKVKLFTPGLKQLAQDMLETMHSYNGVGLAGPQIGVMQRIFVAEIPLPEDPDTEAHPHAGQSFVLVNPELVTTSDELVEGQEGCLSIPTWYGLVNRPTWVEVKAQDVEEKKIKLKVSGLMARIFLHEMDHLDGILFIDYIKDQEKLWQILPEDEKEAAEAASYREIR